MSMQVSALSKAVSPQYAQNKPVFGKNPEFKKACQALKGAADHQRISISPRDVVSYLSDSINVLKSNGLSGQEALKATAQKVENSGVKIAANIAHQKEIRLNCYR